MIDIQVSTQSASEIQTDLLLVLTANANKQGLLRELDRQLEGQLSLQMQREDYKAKTGQNLCCTTWGRIAAPWLYLLGLGEEHQDGGPFWCRTSADAVRAAMSYKPRSIAIAFNGRASDLNTMLEGLALGVWLANYRFDTHKTGDNDTSGLESVTLLLPVRSSAAILASAQEAVAQSRILAESICVARDLVNEPSNVLTPTQLAHRAQTMADQYGLQCHVYGPAQLREWGMNLFLAVSAGSVEEPRLIHLIYRPETSRKKKTSRVIALVGKGVTFDSGGLSLKPQASMLDMHADMAGAAAVFGAMQAIAQLKPSCEVHGYLGATENMTGAAAYKLNDVFTSYNKKTVEIRNTDAEGRLVLADTMAYASTQGTTEMIDVATLTGACMVALGPWTAGLMTNHQPMADHLLRTSQQVGEELWQLPMVEELRSSLKSSTADLSNVGGKYGGAISAALFLREFVPESVHWCHLDIAGPSFVEKDLHHIKKGGTGFGVTTLVEYVMKSAKP